jgi:hypothetical protein
VLETQQSHFCHLLHSAVTKECVNGRFEEVEDSDLLAVLTWQDVIAQHLIAWTYWHWPGPLPPRLLTSLCLHSPLTPKAPSISDT